MRHVKILLQQSFVGLDLSDLQKIGWSNKNEKSRLILCYFAAIGCIYGIESPFQPVGFVICLVCELFTRSSHITFTFICFSS